ncbi:hypothetical protein [Nocardia seriolae]|uniref:DUF8175 domain-containing protein n=1 Tax=Nocardia seriolae TaxID=37332 RepID=A0A0B8N8J4_9NOCA|nr:hypothetical protein [Nocardia seriolae]APA99849.1 hypothetical protein NS506_05812 [Nocardia seriolae]MTJ64543.1 hypothetical protein [Nocardia seriolae]MTJ73391.1 hypothetical protein [Nocardia seriolae]MTJ89386.1 hypothetical protein [Nocardia seriolae]MTK33362.1 hypothetical protein [Nocardia seriolae]
MRAKPAHHAQTFRAVAAALLVTACALTAAACGSSDKSAATKTTQPDPARAPADVHWQNYQGVQLPIGEHDGPSKLGTAAAGYSRTPQGAALAAINHSTRLSLAPDGIWPQLAASSLIPGPAKDSWVLARAQISVTAPANPAVAPRITAYKLTTYTPDRADLTVYATYSDASITATAETVLWVSDDWRLLLPDPAAKTVTVQSVPAIPADTVNLNPPK